MLKKTELTISGCRVKFPAKPYRSQVAMMSKIITSLQRSQNSLLESPTGSGKSLALLCASLAWQEAEQARVDNFNMLLAQAQETQDPAIRDTLLALAGPGVEMDDDEVIIQQPTDAAARQTDPEQDSGGGFMIPDPEMEDFMDSGSKPKKGPISEDSLAYHLPGGDVQLASAGPNLLKLPKKQRVPTIYFGTRTHKQVAQIVRELKKTGYSHVRMTLLASREHTCIHPTVSKCSNKTQECQDLMDKKKGGGCRYQHNVKSKLASHHSLRVQLGHDEAWDLEDIVKVGKKLKCCPYYAVRELRTSAQLVICPYNYLVDPKIRKSMEINLKNQVVVLDEAHNIEDSARDAVSAYFDIDDIVKAMQECERMVGLGILATTHSGLADFCSRLAQWMKRSLEGKTDYSDYNSSSRVWTGTTGMAEWNELVFPPADYMTIKNMLEEAIKEQQLAAEDQEAGYEDASPAIISKKALDTISDVFMILEYMYTKESLYRDDYRMAVVQTQTRKRVSTGWNRKGRENTSLVKVITLHFWCLNPGVCFDELKNSCRSIVLTSGTLSPIVTFASELDVKFPITLEADHVIDRKQVWVGTLSRGPTGHNLNATYKNTETLAFQDEIGKLIRDVCYRVPHGILVFLPSYKMLDNMTQRWQTTGTWADIMSRKVIVSEPKFSDKLDDVMKEFYEAVAINTNEDSFSVNGALFLAVCRGKVSEGLDFADNNARAVICVGIPFPNVKDSLVDLKRKYNDHKRSTQDPNILSGGEWYEIQAFRALNQALGRCIRHRKDWGAILMVDDRYARNERYVNGLSKWVRKNVMHFSSCANMFNNLDRFIQDMKHLEREEREIQSQLQAETTQVNSKDSPQSVLKNESEVAHEASFVAPVEGGSVISSGWKLNDDPKVSGSPKPESRLQKSDLDDVETLSSKLSKLQEFRRAPVAKLEKYSSSNLDSSTHLNKGGVHVNGLNSSQSQAETKYDASKKTVGKYDTKNAVDHDSDHSGAKRKFLSSSGSSDGVCSPGRNVKAKFFRKNDSHEAGDSEADSDLGNLTDTVRETYLLYKKKKDLASVAASRGLKAGTVSSHLALAMEAGHDVDIASLGVTSQIVAAVARIIHASPILSDVSRLSPIKNELELAGLNQVTYEYLRLVITRLKIEHGVSPEYLLEWTDEQFQTYLTDQNSSTEVRAGQNLVPETSPSCRASTSPLSVVNTSKTSPPSPVSLSSSSVVPRAVQSVPGAVQSIASSSPAVSACVSASPVSKPGSLSRSQSGGQELETPLRDSSNIKENPGKLVGGQQQTASQETVSSGESSSRKRKERESSKKNYMNLSIVSLKSTDLLKTNLDDIVSEDKTENAHWSNLIRKRKEKRVSRENLENEDTNRPAIPDTPEKEDPGIEDVNIDWEEDMFLTSDEELTSAMLSIPDKQPDKEQDAVKARKPLFDRNFINDKTDKKDAVEKKTDAELNVTSSSADTSIRSDCRSPQDYIDESAESSFIKGKLSKKKRKKRNSKDKSFSRMPKLPLCDNSDDDFK